MLEQAGHAQTQGQHLEGEQAGALGQGREPQLPRHTQTDEAHQRGHTQQTQAFDGGAALGWVVGEEGVRVGRFEVGGGGVGGVHG